MDACTEREWNTMTIRELTLDRAWMRRQRNATRKVAQCSINFLMRPPVFVQLGRRAIAVALCALLIPVSEANLLAQESVPPPPPPASAAPTQPLTPDQLDQLVAPIALYPDALIAQTLAASTYPTEIVDADRWLQAQTGASPQQIASKVNRQSWDPSVKALTAFPTVLAQMDKNLDWTTNLGNAYYNQPQDVMNAIQTMRQRAQGSGNLKATQQQTVSSQNGSIVIAPANPSVVYVPAYNPWVVYGAPLAIYPGFYYAPPPGVFFGTGLAIGFGIGIGIGLFAHWGWGWNNWRLGWRSRAVVFNHTTYITHSRTVINRGFNRAGGPSRGAAARGSYARAAHANHGMAHSFNQAHAQRAGRTAGFNRGGMGGRRSFGGGRRGGGGRR
jgi:hypothetical protein